MHWIPRGRPRVVRLQLLSRAQKNGASQPSKNSVDCVLAPSHIYSFIFLFLLPSCQKVSGKWNREKIQTSSNTLQAEGRAERENTPHGLEFPYFSQVPNSHSQQHTINRYDGARFYQLVCGGAFLYDCAKIVPEFCPESGNSCIYLTLERHLQVDCVVPPFVYHATHLYRYLFLASTAPPKMLVALFASKATEDFKRINSMGSI